MTLYIDSKVSVLSQAPSGSSDGSLLLLLLLEILPKVSNFIWKDKDVHQQPRFYWL